MGTHREIAITKHPPTPLGLTEVAAVLRVYSPHSGRVSSYLTHTLRIHNISNVVAIIAAV